MLSPVNPGGNWHRNPGYLQGNASQLPPPPPTHLKPYFMPMIFPSATPYDSSLFTNPATTSFRPGHSPPQVTMAALTCGEGCWVIYVVEAAKHFMMASGGDRGGCGVRG